MKFFTICGSLQAHSANAALLRTAVAAAPAGVEVVVFGLLGAVPYFNAGEDAETYPAVVRLRAEIAGADGVIIATPEYGHSLPGVLKNALDWLVRSGELVNTPVAILSASPTPTGGLRAMMALTQTLLAQSAAVVALHPVADIREKVDAQGEVVDTSTIRRIAVAALVDACPGDQGTGG